MVEEESCAEQADEENIGKDRIARVKQKQFEFERKQSDERRLAVEGKRKKIKKNYWNWIIILLVLIVLIGLVYVFQIF